MSYDFNALTNRFNTASYKWDIKDNELPMWVADMDFKTAPPIIEALTDRLKHGIFGYSISPLEWNNAITGWWETRHGFKIDADSLLFSSGIVPAISSIVRKMTTVGENVLLQTPVYNVFFNSILNNGRHVLENRLICEDGVYTIDFDDLEKKLSDPQTTMMILCNPHNPIGKIWDKDTLAAIGELCHKHHVLVVSDEIHCDVTDPGTAYVPFASVSEKCRDNSVTCISPTKSFNIAGLQTAAVMVPNPVLRYKVDRGLNTDEVAEPNVFAVTAAIAAFTQGGDWLDELRKYIFDNKCLANTFIKEEIPFISVVSSQATYLLWLDCRQLGVTSNDLCDFIRHDSGLILSSGSSYGENGDGFLRMNIACPQDRLKDGLERLKKSITHLAKNKPNNC